MGTEKKKPGRWKTGQSGNPAGRPKGLGEVTKLRESIAAHLPEIIAQLVTKAKEGDSQAARLLLERVLPAMKPIEQAVILSMPDDTLTEQGRAVLASVAAGELAPGQGAQLIAAIGTLGKIAEIDELTARITALEILKGGQHGNA